MEFDQIILLEDLQIPVEIMKAYKTGREYFYNGGEPTREYICKVHGYIRANPSRVVTEIKTGEARGSNKGGRSGQSLADTLFNTRFGNRLYRETGKRPMAHYFALVQALNILCDKGILDPAKHPNYDKKEIELAEIFAAASISLARFALPRLYPEYAHHLVFEVPVANVGQHLISALNPDTFLDFALTNYQAQEDAATISDSYKSQATDFVFSNKLTEMKVFVDRPNIKPQEMAQTTGTRQSMMYWRNLVNERMVEALPDLTVEELEKNVDLRNNKALRRYYRMLAQDRWGVRPDRILIRDNPYIGETKHYFHDLMFYHLTLGSDHKICRFNLDPVLEWVRSLR